MRVQKIASICLALLTAVALLAGCGSSQTATSDGAAAGTLSAQGVAVDPYIVGAIFQEVAADGTVLQQSTPSDANGRFQFPNPLTPGSTIASKASATGTHNGAPYSGILKRRLAGEDSTWVVSPLTTLTAAGMTDQQLLDLFDGAGLAGLTAADLTADPMSGLGGAAAITASTDLAPLQANMAANAFMQALGNNQFDPATLADPNHATLWQGMVTAVTTVVSPATFQALATDASVATSGAPLSVDDFIRTAANLCQAISNNVRQELANNSGTPTMGAMQTIVDDALATAPALAHQYYASRVGEVPAPDGATLYANDCAGCHGALASSSKAGRSAAQIQAAIDANYGGMGSLNLTATEIQAIADALAPAPRRPRRPTPTPAPTPTPDGATLYTDNCASCHGALASSAKAGATAAQIQAAIDANFGGMGSLNLTATEIQAIADALAQASAPAPAPTPAPTLDGATLYGDNCTGCHGSLANSTKAGATAAQIQAAIDANYGGMGSLNLTAEQIQAIADVLPPAPTPDPGTPTTLDGATLYADNCAGCHGDLASSTKAGATAPQIQAAIDANFGGMGSLNLTAEQIQAIADVLPPADAGTPAGPDYSDCTACHGQPPNGSAYPNEAGAHATHQALAGVGTNCDVCHSGASHNGTLDINIKAAYNAKSGVAGLNPDGSDTCVNVSCHGGKMTPDWFTGSLNVDTDCQSCHASGTGQYNSYYSGKHGKHSGRACTDCHNTSTLAVNHFGRLDTTTMEGPASATIGGGSTRISSYDASTRICVGCHGTATW